MYLKFKFFGKNSENKSELESTKSGFPLVWEEGSRYRMLPASYG